MYDLLVSPDCLPDLLQGSLKNKGRDEAFLLSSFRLFNKAPTSLFSVYNPKDNNKYLELSVQAKLNKGVSSNRKILHLCFTVFFILFCFCPKFSDSALPEDGWTIWHHQFQPPIPGRWADPSCHAACQRSTARPPSPRHVCRLQAGSHFKWSASCVWVTSFWSQQGGSEDSAVGWTGEWGIHTL